GYDESLPSMTSLGVKEIIPYIEGEMPLEDCLEILKRNTRRYAKRQMTWLKRYDNVRWLTPK
ncbi:MAG: tRNA (adenosine(37)-N6)-dimethylallyltransferase MiaA, partial [Nitrospirae bacterium]|nr:tRNA (adenosine(37)-N6)-dimethylallyltransferase MiaA [Nitrospirota bacterium]